MGNSVESTSDERTVNNTMRHRYRVLSDAEKSQVEITKTMGGDLLTWLDGLGSSREVDIAKTRLEEAIMWAVKHITR